MRKLAATALTLAFAALIAIPALAATTKHVRVGDDLAFHPSSLKIKHKTKVVWKWDGGVVHNVTLIKAPHGVKKFHSHDQMTGTYSHTFKVRGRYTLECTIHGFMMKIRVT
jgi:plastocyanin